MNCGTFKGKDLLFDPVEHRYSWGGKPLISVTQMLTKMGLKKEPSEEIKQSAGYKKATEYGTLVHKQIEQIVLFGLTEFKGVLTVDAKWFAEGVLPMCKSWIPEMRLMCDVCGGCVDLVGWLRDGRLIVIDHKTGTSWTAEEVALQISLYLYMMYWLGLITKEQYMEAVGYCDDLKGKASRLVPLRLLSIEEVEALLDCFKNGKKYEPLAILMEDNEQQTVRKLEEFYALVEVLDNMEERIKKEFKDRIVSSPFGYMNSRDGSIKVKLIHNNGRVLFDTDSFEKDHPDLYEQYTKRGKSYDYVSMTFSDDFKKGIEKKKAELMETYGIKQEDEDGNETLPYFA